MTECTVCPDWLERCSHFDGIIIWLGKMNNPRLLQTLVGHHAEDNGFVVCQGNAIVRCGCSPEHLRLHRGEDQPREAKFLHLADAEAEFTHREAALLGREA